MQLVLELGVADLAGTRFAISPLHETLRALPLLAKPARSAVNRPWVRWALAELDRRALRLPRVWPLIVTDLPYWPEFLFPAPAVRAPGLDVELACLCATPDDQVRASLRRVFGGGRWPDSATDLFERPQGVLAEIAAEVADYHDRLIAPHWERMRSVLEADISYHAELLAGGGARSLFSELHPGLRWSAGQLLMTDEEAWPENPLVTLGPGGLVLLPSVFAWPDWSIKKSTSTQTTLLYPARGDATAVELLLGAPRTRLLEALCSPATTTALARRLGVTPSAVSQHLTVLHRGGLVDRHRSGRTVLYQTSELGLALLDGALPRSGLKPELRSGS